MKDKQEYPISCTWIMPISPGDDPNYRGPGDISPFTTDTEYWIQKQKYWKEKENERKGDIADPIEGDKKAPKTFPIFQEKLYHGPEENERMIYVAVPGYKKSGIEIYVLDHKLCIKTKNKCWPTNGIDISVDMDENIEKVSLVDLTNGILTIRLKLKPIVTTKSKKHIIPIT